MNTKMMKPTIRHQTGATLIEVLVAVLIFSFGLLGLVGLQSRAVQHSGSAEDRNRAAALAAEAAAQMYTLRTANLPGSASSVYSNWKTKVATAASAGLPAGSATITYTAATATAPAVADIVIQWQAPNSAQSTYRTQVVEVPPVAPPASISSP